MALAAARLAPRVQQASPARLLRGVGRYRGSSLPIFWPGKTGPNPKLGSSSSGMPVTGSRGAGAAGAAGEVWGAQAAGIGTGVTTGAEGNGVGGGAEAAGMWTISGAVNAWTGSGLPQGGSGLGNHMSIASCCFLVQRGSRGEGAGDACG